MRGKAPLRTRLLILAVLCPIIGGIVIGVSWKEWQTHSHLEKNGVRILGTVESSERRTSKRTSSYNLQVSYRIENRPVSQRFIAKDEVANEHPPGSPVEVVYDPKEPSHALLTKSLNPGEKQLLMLIGAFIFVGSPVCAFAALRMAR